MGIDTVDTIGKIGKIGKRSGLRVRVRLRGLRVRGRIRETQRGGKEEEEGCFHGDVDGTAAPVLSPRRAGGL